MYRCALQTLTVALYLMTMGSELAWSETARDQAREHAARGRALYEEERYDEALEAYLAAYDVMPVPGVLFNLGQCHRHLGSYERAIELYEQYLNESPEAPNHAAVETLIDQCRAELESGLSEGHPDLGDDAGPQRTDEHLDDAGPEDRSIDGGEVELSGAEEEPQFDRPREQESSAPSQLLASETDESDTEVSHGEERPRRFYQRWWFWTIVGTVIVGATIGATVAVTTGDPTTVLPQGSLGTLDGREWQPTE